MESVGIDIKMRLAFANLVMVISNCNNYSCGIDNDTNRLATWSCSHVWYRQLIIVKLSPLTIQS